MLVACIKTISRCISIWKGWRASCTFQWQMFAQRTINPNHILDLLANYHMKVENKGKTSSSLLKSSLWGLVLCFWYALPSSWLQRQYVIIYGLREEILHTLCKYLSRRRAMNFGIDMGPIWISRNILFFLREPASSNNDTHLDVKEK